MDYYEVKQKLESVDKYIEDIKITKEMKEKKIVCLDPGNSAIFVTCYENRDFKSEKMFEFTDGGRLVPKNFSLKTSSIEVVVTTLIHRGVAQMEND